MAVKTIAVVSQKFAAVAERIDTWRRTREKRSRMPEGLWREAVGLARVRGVHAVARALKLDYYSLKRRLPGAAAPAPGPRFVEVALTQRPVAAELTVEMARPDGIRMTVREATTLDLVELARVVFVQKP